MLTLTTLVEKLNAKGIAFVQSSAPEKVKGFMSHTVEYVSKLGNTVKVNFGEYYPESFSSKITKKAGNESLSKFFNYDGDKVEVFQTKQSDKMPRFVINTRINHLDSEKSIYSIIKGNQPSETDVHFCSVINKKNGFRFDPIVNQVSSLIRL